MAEIWIIIILVLICIDDVIVRWGFYMINRIEYAVSIYDHISANCRTLDIMPCVTRYASAYTTQE